jgi:hypothetical protein
MEDRWGEDHTRSQQSTMNPCPSISSQPLLGSEPLGLGHTRADWDDLSEYKEFLKTTSKPRILYFSSWTVGPARQKYIPNKKKANMSKWVHRTTTGHIIIASSRATHLQTRQQLLRTHQIVDAGTASKRHHCWNMSSWPLQSSPDARTIENLKSQQRIFHSHTVESIEIVQVNLACFLTLLAQEA